MSEEVKEVKTSMGDILSGKEPEAVETPVETTETAPVAEATSEVTEPVKEESTVEDPKPAEVGPQQPKESLGLLKALQAERKKRQELEAQLKQNSYQEPVYEEPQSPQADDTVKTQILSISESSARAAHPDYQEKYDAFLEAVTSGPEINYALYESVMNSSHPGEAAYQAGKIIQAQKKYGTDFDTQLANIRKEVEQELREKLRAEIEAEFSGKVSKRLNQPTNILAGRSASGGEKPSFTPTSFRDLLKHKRG